MSCSESVTPLQRTITSPFSSRRLGRTVRHEALNLLALRNLLFRRILGRKLDIQNPDARALYRPGLDDGQRRFHRRVDRDRKTEPFGIDGVPVFVIGGHEALERDDADNLAAAV